LAFAIFHLDFKYSGHKRTENQIPCQCQKGFSYLTINEKKYCQGLKHFTAYLGHQKDSKCFALSMNLEFYSSEAFKVPIFFPLCKKCQAKPAMSR